MNSIRLFVNTLVHKSNNIVRDTADVCLLDSILLDNGCIWHDIIPKNVFYRGNRENHGGTNFAWVVIFEEKPYFVSGFDIRPSIEKIKVIIHLREFQNQHKTATPAVYFL